MAKVMDATKGLAPPQGNGKCTWGLFDPGGWNFEFSTFPARLIQLGEPAQYAGPLAARSASRPIELNENQKSDSPPILRPVAALAKNTGKRMILMI